MKKRFVYVLLVLMLLFVALAVTAPPAAFAHHAGLNPGVGYINEEMVHNGEMERAADMGFWNQPWELVEPPAP